jgi:hypothetical protein
MEYHVEWVELAEQPSAVVWGGVLRERNPEFCGGVFEEVIGA